MNKLNHERKEFIRQASIRIHNFLCNEIGITNEDIVCENQDSAEKIFLAVNIVICVMVNIINAQKTEEAKNECMNEIFKIIRLNVEDNNKGEKE